VRQSVDLFQHRRDLLLVVGGLNHVRRDYQKTFGRHQRLRVVALLEAAARHRHDPRVLVGQIDLICGLRPLDRRRRRPAAGVAPDIPTFAEMGLSGRSGRLRCSLSASKTIQG
jgi:hypothetical protein